MALKKNYVETRENFSGSLTASDAYWRVSKISGTKNNMTMFVNVSETSGRIQITEKMYSFVPDLNGKNFIAQAYEHLKTLPEFAGATDC
jgi:hypothetical protein